MTDPLTFLATALNVGAHLQNWQKKINEAEFKKFLVDISNELSDARLEVADLKVQLLKHREEIASLKEQLTRKDGKTPIVKSGGFIFPPDEQPYCISCYQKQGQKNPLTRSISHFNMCPVCHTQTRR